MHKTITHSLIKNEVQMASKTCWTFVLRVWLSFRPNAVINILVNATLFAQHNQDLGSYIIEKEVNLSPFITPFQKAAHNFYLDPRVWPLLAWKLNWWMQIFPVLTFWKFWPHSSLCPLRFTESASKISSSSRFIK